VLPETIEGGWTSLEFTNTGREWHEFALAKLGEGKTIADVQRYLADPKSQQQPPPDWVQIRAGIPTLDAGENASLTEQLEPGRYVLLCFLDAPDGKTHIEHGMLREFVVEGNAEADRPERGPAPARFLGGVIDVPPHTSVYYTVNLDEGR
jgi:hypothetical protein